MRKGRRSALFVMAFVLCASGAVLLSVTTSATAAPGSRRVRLVLPREPLTTAEAVRVTVVNGSASAIYRSLCFVLERSTVHGWQLVRRSHGVPVACTIWAGVVQGAHSRQPEGLELYDDLRPGSYRITLFYRPVPKHARV